MKIGTLQDVKRMKVGVTYGIVMAGVLALIVAVALVDRMTGGAVLAWVGSHGMVPGR